MQYTKAVAGMISERYSQNGHWWVDSTELARTLQLSYAELYQHIYRLRRGVDSIAIGRFDRTNAHLLADLVAAVTNEDAPGSFERLGIVLSHEDQTRLMERYLDEVAGVVARHKPDTEQFRAMLRVFKTRSRALEVYIGHFFDLEELVPLTAEGFCRSSGYLLQALARENAERFLRLLHERNIVAPERVFAGLISQLLGGTRDPGRASETAAPGPEIVSALAVLGITDPAPDLESVRSQYRSLMKAFHPDINPAGLQRAQKINDAYSRIAAWLRGVPGRSSGRSPARGARGGR